MTFSPLSSGVLLGLLTWALSGQVMTQDLSHGLNACVAHLLPSLERHLHEAQRLTLIHVAGGSNASPR